MATIHTVSLHNPAAARLEDFTPKPTSVTEGQIEASLSVWSEGGVDTGVWECTPGVFHAERNGYTEICTMLSGRVTLEVEGAEPEEYGPGDIFVTPSGWKGVWHVHETVRKHYTIITD